MTNELRKPREWGADKIADGKITRVYSDGEYIGRTAPSDGSYRNADGTAMLHPISGEVVKVYGEGCFDTYSGKDGAEYIGTYHGRENATQKVLRNSDY